MNKRKTETAKPQRVPDETFVKYVKDFGAIDHMAVQSIFSLDRDDEPAGSFLLDLLREVEASAPEIISRLAKARSVGSLQTVAHLAHKLKGICRNVGISRTAAVCDYIENAATSGHLAHQDFFEALAPEMEYAQTKLKSLCQRHNKKPSPAPTDRAPARRKKVRQPARSRNLSAELVVNFLKDQAIFTIDPHGFVTTWNQGAESIVGYRSNEIIGRHFSTFYTEKDQAAGEPTNHLDIARSLGKFEAEAVRLKKDGSHYWAHIVITPIFDESGELEGYLNYRRDVTHRKHVEHDLAKSQRTLAGLFENHHDAVFFVNEDDRPIDVNAAFFDLTGYSKAEILDGHHYEALTPENWRQVEATHISALHSTRLMQKYEKEIIHRNGSLILVEVTRFCLNQPDEKPRDFAVVLRDIRRERLAAAEMERARQLSQDASQAKSDFLANMSHEIRTPLTAILGMTHLLSDLELSTEAREYAESISAAGKQLLYLVNDILDISKIEAGKTALISEPFELRDLLDACIKIHAAQAQKKGLGLRLILQEPSTAGAVNTLLGDPNLISQILSNLVGNAVKFSGRGQVDLCVTTTTNNNGTTLCRFEIKDEGVGINQESLAKMFQPFSQADSSTSRRFGGTGLGLSICKRLVDLMKGRIGVESTPGLGSIFWFELDLKNAAYKEVGTTVDATGDKHRTGGLIPQGSRRILVVDDHPMNQKVAIRFLKQIGYEADAADGGKASLARLESQSYGLILMDCQMPELDGYETTRLIRQSALPQIAAVPIVAMTASAMAGDRERCLAAGMNDYLTKPIDLTQLKISLEKLLPLPNAVHQKRRNTHGAT